MRRRTSNFGVFGVYVLGYKFCNRLACGGMADHDTETGWEPNYECWVRQRTNPTASEFETAPPSDHQTRFVIGDGRKDIDPFDGSRHSPAVLHWSRSSTSRAQSNSALVPNRLPRRLGGLQGSLSDEGMCSGQLPPRDARSRVEPADLSRTRRQTPSRGSGDILKTPCQEFSVPPEHAVMYEGLCGSILRSINNQRHFLPSLCQRFLVRAIGLALRTSEWKL